jgi:hypothetical protein
MILRRISTIVSSLVAIALLAALPADAAEWGTIKGKFVYEGEPTNEPLKLTQDAAFCGKHNPVDERIVVGKDGGLQNVFVYLAEDDDVPVHDDYASQKGKTVHLDNKGCRFEPHALTLWTEQKLEVSNSDQGVAHNTNVTKLFANRGKAFNTTIPNDKPLEVQFDKSEKYPVSVVCNVHPWMSAILLVRTNPYMVVSGEDGSFEIKNVPAGDQTFVFWHEAKGNLRDLKVGKEKASRKGEVKLKVPAGETLDLGEINIAPDILGQKG